MQWPARPRRFTRGEAIDFLVEMVHTIPVDDKVKAEAELHRLFREKRTNGEWFRLTAEDLAKITGLKKYVGGHWVMR